MFYFKLHVKRNAFEQTTIDARFVLVSVRHNVINTAVRTRKTFSFLQIQSSPFLSVIIALMLTMPLKILE